MYIVYYIYIYNQPLPQRPLAPSFACVSQGGRGRWIQAELHNPFPLPVLNTCPMISRSLLVPSSTSGDGTRHKPLPAEKAPLRSGRVYSVARLFLFFFSLSLSLSLSLLLNGYEETREANRTAHPRARGSTVFMPPAPLFGGRSSNWQAWQRAVF